MQKHGSQYRPLAYFSLKLSPEVLGLPSCLRSVAVVAAMIEKSAAIVLTHDCMLAAQKSQYEALIFSSLARSPALNTATFLPLPDLEKGHDCEEVIDSGTSPRSYLMQTPCQNH